MTNTPINIECSPNPKVNLISATSQLAKSSLKKSLDTNHRWFSPPVLGGSRYSEEVSLQILRKIYGKKKYVLGFKCFPKDIYNSANSPTVTAECDYPVYACKFGQSESTKSLLCLAFEDGTISLQQTKSSDEGRFIVEKEAHKDAVFDVCWIPRQNSLLSAVSDSSLTLWTVKNEDLVPIQHFRGHTKAVKCVDANPWDTNVFASGGQDSNLIIWDTRCAKNCIANEIFAVQSSQKALNSPGSSRCSSMSLQNSIVSVKFNQQFSILSAGSSDGAIKIWDLRKTYCRSRREPQSLHTLQNPGTSSFKGYSCMNLSPHKERVYISCLDGRIYTYHLTNPTLYPVAVYYGHRPNSYYAKACLSPCGSYLLSGSSDDHAYIWLTDSPGCPVAALSGHCDEVTSVAWNNDMLVTCSDDMRHRIFKYRLVDKKDTETWRTLQGFAIPYQKCISEKFPTLKHIRTQYNTGNCLTHIISHNSTSSLEVQESKNTLNSNLNTKVANDILPSDIISRVMLTPSQTRLKPKNEVTPRTSESKSLLSWLSSSKKTPKSNCNSLTPNLKSSEIIKSYSKRKLADIMENNQENIRNEDKKPALSPSKNVLSERENQHGSKVVVKMLKYEDVSSGSGSNFDGEELKLVDETEKIESLFSLYKKHKPNTPQSHKVQEENDDAITPSKVLHPISEAYSRSTVALYTSPTANLPNFVIDGRSPHNRESPTVRRRETDWLTTLRRKKSLFVNGKQSMKDDEADKNKGIISRSKNTSRSK